jgi:DNA-binding GntR family transcriptional regulator
MKYNPITSAEIFNDLCEKVRKLELEPGTRISENEMAALYNVSRSTVRSAFSKLEQIDLIEIYPQIGTFISPMNMKYVYDSLYIRNLVEMDVLEDVINLEDKTALLKILKDNLKEQEQFRGNLDYDSEFEKIDHDFHYAILDSVNRQSIMEILKDSFIHICRWRNFDIRCRKRISSLIDDHGLLTYAIEQNDVKLAKETMKKHILNFNEEYLNQIKKDYPNYF